MPVTVQSQDVSRAASGIVIPPAAGRAVDFIQISNLMSLATIASEESDADHRKIGRSRRGEGSDDSLLRADRPLPEAERSSGNQRLYSRKALERLAFIRHARDLGFNLEAIRDLLSLSDKPDQSCAGADAIAKAQLAEVESRLARLTALKK